jgi:hypothetical protein
MQKSFRILFAAALIGLCIWGWWILFPSPERVIRSRLTKLAKTVSFEANTGALAKAYDAQKLTDYLTSDVEIHVNPREYPPQSLSGRDDLIQALMWAQSHFTAFRVELVDINITFGSDKQTATANLTCKAYLSGERDFTPQEFNFFLKKVEKKWLIYRIETVKTLS